MNEEIRWGNVNDPWGRLRSILRHPRHWRTWYPLAMASLRKVQGITAHIYNYQDYISHNKCLFFGSFGLTKSRHWASAFCVKQEVSVTKQLAWEMAVCPKTFWTTGFCSITNRPQTGQRKTFKTWLYIPFISCRIFVPSIVMLPSNLKTWSTF